MLYRIGAEPEQCLMIGDDPKRDGVARQCDIPFFELRSDQHLQQEGPLSYSGNSKALLAYLESTVENHDE